MILPPIGLFSAIKFYNEGYVDVYAGLYMAAIFTIVSYFSSLYTIQLNVEILRKIFGIFTIIAGFYIFFNKS